MNISLFKSLILVITAVALTLLFAPFIFLVQIITLLNSVHLPRYLFNISVSLDQLVNTLFRGDPDLTISERLGHKILKKDYGVLSWRLKACAVLSWAFQEENHCISNLP